MPPAPLKVTVLGSGTSMGVPTLGCPCRVCKSDDPHDKRLRPSVLISRGGQNIVIDTTPDFRQQALRVALDHLDAILLTHGHADHILGFDDIRPFNIRQRSALPVYSNEETFRIIRRVFAYVFDDKPTLSTVPSVTLISMESLLSLCLCSTATWKFSASVLGVPPISPTSAKFRTLPCRYSKVSMNSCWTPSGMSPTLCTRPSNKLLH